MLHFFADGYKGRMRLTTILFGACIACSSHTLVGYTDDDTGAPDAAVDVTADAMVLNPDGAPGKCDPCMDFPKGPILEPGVPVEAPKWFGDPGASSGGPCLVEPEVGSLFPNNWQRPRFRF